MTVSHQSWTDALITVALNPHPQETNYRTSDMSDLSLASVNVGLLINSSAVLYRPALPHTLKRPLNFFPALREEVQPCLVFPRASVMADSSTHFRHEEQKAAVGLSALWMPTICSDLTITSLLLTDWGKRQTKKFRLKNLTVPFGYSTHHRVTQHLYIEGVETFVELFWIVPELVTILLCSTLQELWPLCKMMCGLRCKMFGNKRHIFTAWTFSRTF